VKTGLLLRFLEHDGSYLLLRYKIVSCPGDNDVMLGQYQLCLWLIVGAFFICFARLFCF
jgi:hypothetical protein